MNPNIQMPNTVFTWSPARGRSINYEPPSADLLEAVTLLVRYVTAVEDVVDRRAAARPAQVRRRLRAQGLATRQRAPPADVPAAALAPPGLPGLRVAASPLRGWKWLRFL